jgi:hypothetical protein
MNTIQAQVMTLARYYAKQAVKAQWKAQGKRLYSVEVSDLTREARVYLALHPELFDFAAARYQDFIKRSLAQRQRTKAGAALTTFAQKPKC